MTDYRKFPFAVRAATVPLIAAIILSWVAETKAVILYRTDDPAANTTEPTGTLAGSGWQFQGRFGNFLGTAIAPRFFITARHIGGAPQFIYRGVTYPVIRTVNDTSTDLAIHEISGTFPAYAPLYARSDEVGRQFVVIGRGTRRGPQRVVSGQMRGWEWGAGDLVQRWGQNQVASITSSGRVLYSHFDQAGLAHEAHLSGGDSGGALFINEGGIWKLAGINLDVDHFASGPDGGGPYNAAMFDMRGSYRQNGTLVTGSTPVPSGFYATRISARLSWISSVTGISSPPPPPIGSFVPNDFNLDSKPDLIWQNNRTGERAVWFMDGTSMAGNEFLSTVGLEWQIACTGDFNGDGHPDIVWENNSTGARAIWLMNGVTRLEDRGLPTIATHWQIAASGDFNADQQVDLLWESNVTGQRAVWLMNGTNWVGSRSLPTVATRWQIVGTDDFDRDGQVDIVWQNNVTGERAVWRMNGTTVIGDTFLPTISNLWKIAGTGDYSGDGNADLLWQNVSTGQRSIWLMNGTALVAAHSLPTIPTEWEIRNH